MNITIKDIPAQLHRKLKTRAKANNRSLNGEIIQILQDSERPGIIDRGAFLREVQEFRKTLKVPPLTEEFLREAKNWGRP